MIYIMIIMIIVMIVLIMCISIVVLLVLLLLLFVLLLFVLLVLFRGVCLLASTTRAVCAENAPCAGKMARCSGVQGCGV